MARARLTAMALVCGAVVAAPAWPWAMKTHVWVADTIVADLADGTLDVWEVTTDAAGRRVPSDAPLCLVAPPDEVREAILAYPSEFRAGCCGPDAFPDIYYGQSIIHPYYPGKPWRAIDYARHLLECARDESGQERQRALAWAYGFLCHEAGDALGHTWVNAHTGGAWDWGNMDLVTSHVALEDFLNSRLPHIDLGGDELRLEANEGFIADALVRDDAVSSSVVHAAHLKALVDYRDFFDRGVVKINKLLSKTWGVDLSAGALTSMRAALRAQRNVGDDAIEAWIATSNGIGQEILTGNVLLVPGHVSEWMATWIPQLMGVPQCVLTALEYLGWPMSVVTDWLSEKFMELLQSFYEATLAPILGPYLDPETWYRQTQPVEEQAAIEDEMGLDPGAEHIDARRFGALMDSVQLGRLVLLDGAGVAQVGGALGVDIRWGDEDDNILFDAVNSLDASNQLALYPMFRLLETPDLAERAYARLFVATPYAASPSRIDPAHLWVYSSGEGQLTFAVPTLDPGREGGRLICAVYQEGETLDQRVPWSEQAIPSYGQAGLAGDLLSATYDPAAGREGRYHLSTGLAAEGSNEIAEDLGADIRVTRPWPWVTGSDATNGEQAIPADWGAFLPGGEAPTQEEIAQLRERLLDSMRQQADELEQMGQPQLAQALRERIAEVEAETPGAQSPAAAEPWTYPAEVTAFLREGLADGSLVRGGDSVAVPEGMGEDLPDARWAVGRVETEAGEPVTGATVTLVERSVYDELRASAGVPVVRLDEWLPHGQYLFGRTNEDGDYLLAFVPGGSYVLIASALHLAKCEQPVEVVLGDAAGLLLPSIRLSAEPGAEGTSQAQATAPSYQDVYAPGVHVEVDDPLLGWDRADEDGIVEATVSLLPLGGFSGPVTVSLEGVPEGVGVEVLPEMLVLAEPAEVTLRVRGGGSSDAFGSVTLAVSGEGVSVREPLLLSLAVGRMVLEPELPDVRVGGVTRFRMAYEGIGQGPVVRAEGLPEGLSLRLQSIRQNRSVEPLTVEGLTVAGAQGAADALRVLVPLIVQEAPEPVAVSKRDVEAAPIVALQRGVLLGPEGWVDVAVRAAPELPPGEYPLTLVLTYGERYVLRQEIVVVVAAE